MPLSPTVTPRTVTVRVRLSPAEHRTLRRAAKAADVPMSTLMRRAALMEARDRADPRYASIRATRGAE